MNRPVTVVVAAYPQTTEFDGQQSQRMRLSDYPPPNDARASRELVVLCNIVAKRPNSQFVNLRFDSRGPTTNRTLRQVLKLVAQVVSTKTKLYFLSLIRENLYFVTAAAKATLCFAKC